MAAEHARAARPEDTDWAAIDRHYAALERLQPSPVVTLNRAVAVAKVRGPAAALAMIEPLAAAAPGYFHFFGVKGALLNELGRAGEARVAFDRAIALANTAAEAAHIRLHLDRLIKDGAATGSFGASEYCACSTARNGRGGAAAEAEALTALRTMRLVGATYTAHALHSTRAARTARVRNGKAVVIDGPFAETKESCSGSCWSRPGTSTRRSAWR